LSAPSAAGSNTISLPTLGGTMMASGSMPAFSVYRSTTQTYTVNTWTKVQFNVEEFDTNNNFDSTTNYRFTPTVAGYYQLISNISQETTGTNIWNLYLQIYKNGAGVGKYININVASGNFATFGGTISGLTYANGTTDYFEIYVYSNASLPNLTGGTGGPCYFNGFLARPA
jgi:hypothetical protein